MYTVQEQKLMITSWLLFGFGAIAFFIGQMIPSEEAARFYALKQAEKEAEQVGQLLAAHITETLNEDQARALVERAIGDCAIMHCQWMTVRVDESVPNERVVTVIYEGLDEQYYADIRAIKHTLIAEYVSSENEGSGWVLGPPITTERICKRGHGHQEMSSDPCLQPYAHPAEITDPDAEVWILPE